MVVLGIETSCDETGVALYSSENGLLAQALHSQVAMHERYGGVVPELASRDHIRRVVPLVRQVLAEAGLSEKQIDAIAYTQGPGLAGALLVGAGVATAMAWGLGVPAVGIHHLEGHLLSPLLSADPPAFPFVALLVSGGHTQLMDVAGLGRYEMMGDTLDDASGEAFDKSAKLLGLGYPGGPAIARLAEQGRVGRFKLPRPMLHSNDLDFSFSGLKTAVATLVRRELPQPSESSEPSRARQPTEKAEATSPPSVLASEREAVRADIAAEVQAAIVEVLVAKSVRAIQRGGRTRLVVAGGVSANRMLRARLAEAIARLDGDVSVYFPEPLLCADNGAMIALAGAMRLTAGTQLSSETPVDGSSATAAFLPSQAIHGPSVRPRWPLDSLSPG